MSGRGWQHPRHFGIHMPVTALPNSANASALRWVIIAALAVFGGVVWWGGRGAHGDSPATAATVATALGEQADVSESAEVSAAAPGRDEFAATSNPGAVADLPLGTYVSGKYRFLFDSDLAPEAADKLRAALLERERIAVAINTGRQSSDPAAKAALPRQQSELDDLDRKIGALLRPADIAMFDVLKNSDVEQFQLDDYAGGISAIAPLNDSDRKAILYTKMVHRQRFRQVLADSRLMSDELNAGERRQAFGEVSRALAISRDHYLQEVRQYLYNDEQFSLLSNYEKTEFAAELDKLRGIAGAE